MRKVGAAKDKIDKYIEMEEKAEPRERRDEPLSEGEAPDSPPRKTEGPEVPLETDVKEMYKYLNKMRPNKREEIKDRNKDFTKVSDW